MRRSTRRLTTALLVVAALALVAAACTGDNGDTTFFARDGSEFDEGAPAATIVSDLEGAPEAPAEDGERFAGAGQGADGFTPIAFQVQDLGRDIIFTADLTVAVPDVAAAEEEAIAAVQSVDGFLFGQQTRGGAEAVSVLTFKVPPQAFQAALRQLADIGELRTQDVSADDVTERVVDLESRIGTAAASVARLKEFLDDANDIVTITELEAALLDRETELETLRGQLRTIRDRVDLATIVLTLTEAEANPQLAVSLSAYRGHDDGGLSCPGSSNLTVDRGDDVTVCIAVTNAGDTPLTNIEVTDAVLGVETGDLIVVFGDPQAVIEPGQSVDLAAEVTVERTIRTQTRVTATPVDPDGNEIEARTVFNTSTLGVSAVDPGGLPGFGEGLSAAVDVLAWVGGVIVLSAGFLLPFLPLLALAALALWWWSRRRRSREPSPAADEAATAD